MVPAEPTMLDFVDPASVDGLVTMTLTEGESARRYVHVTYPRLKDAPRLNEALREEAERQLSAFRDATAADSPDPMGSSGVGSADTGDSIDGGAQDKRESAPERVGSPAGEASRDVDAEGLRASEGLRAAEGLRAEAGRSRKGVAGSEVEGFGWSDAGVYDRFGPRPELNVDWQLVAASHYVVGVRLRTGQYLGADWGRSGRIVWYDRARDVVSGSAGLLSGQEALQEVARLVKEGLKGRGPAVDLNEVKADGQDLDSMAFNRNGDLVVEFDDCQIASCSLGRVGVAVPASQAQALLSETGRRAQRSARAAWQGMSQKLPPGPPPSMPPGVFNVTPSTAGGPDGARGGRPSAPTTETGTMSSGGAAALTGQAGAPQAGASGEGARSDVPPEWSGPPTAQAGSPSGQGGPPTPQGSASGTAPRASVPPGQGGGPETGVVGRPEVVGMSRPDPGSRAVTVDCERVKCVALTFDDGPGPDTPRLLDILRGAGARATFFTVGTNAAATPGLLRRMSAEGHVIGNHSWSHRDLSKLSTSKIADSLGRTQDLVASQVGRPPTLARAPYGAVSKNVSDIAREMGLTLVGWDVNTAASPEAWASPATAPATAPAETHAKTHTEAHAHAHADTSAERVVVARRAVEGARAGAIILLHDTSQATVDAVPAILKELRGKGYAFVTVPELYGDGGPTG
ncbi:polysaccharide deacetylase family protein [Nonomuraea lactucae]|uniref:polysaccharide deacetylase family protein n=1 Tax=Nonomuraea lactucae TaxID=2249762 RepID=UPI001F0678BF|nr:polysaccharide deacetylase family protein [Nonomuraea lactucae]